MKYIVLIAWVSLLSSCGRYIPTEIEDGKLLGVVPLQHGKGSYQSVRPVNATREDIFRQSRRWAAFHIPNPAKVLDISDNLVGDIITTGSLIGGAVKIGKQQLIMPSVEYVASLESYENSYRLTLTNFRINGQSTPHPIEVRHSAVNKKVTRLTLQQIDMQVQALMDNLHEFITTEIKTSPIEAAR